MDLPVAPGRSQGQQGIQVINSAGAYEVLFLGTAT
jgi:hypothetical protein